MQLPSLASHQFLPIALILLFDFLLPALVPVELLLLLCLLLMISVLLSFIQLANEMLTFKLEVSERGSFSVVDVLDCSSFSLVIAGSSMYTHGNLPFF